MKALNGYFLEMNLADVFDGLENVGVYLTDTDRRIIFWNRAAEKITGHCQTDVVGRCCGDGVLNHIDRHGRLLCAQEFCPLFHAIRSGKSNSLQTFVFGKKPDGKRIPLSVTVSPVRGVNGQIVGGIELFRDATLEWEQLKMAQGIQRRFMPDPEETNRLLPMAFYLKPAEMVGGDYVQINRVDENVVTGLLADVSGHGIASALLTGFLWRALEDVSKIDGHPAEILRKLDMQYRTLGLETHYFSALCFRYDLFTETLDLANAGHPLPILIDKDGKAECVRMNGDLIGLFEDPQFEDRSIKLSGLRLIAFSDGCVEAHDPNGEELGFERFLTSCRETLSLPRSEAARSLVEKSFAFSRSPEPEDDMTALIIESRCF